MRVNRFEIDVHVLVPLLLSNVLQSVGQLFGMVVVGRWLGVNDLAAISAFFPLFFLLVSFVIGIGSGVPF